jgi:hypothetical protein
MTAMALIATATVYGLFCCYIIFPLAGLPAGMHRLAMTLLVAELAAVGLWSYHSADCGPDGCGWLAEAGRSAAMVDIPLLGVTLVMFAIAWGLTAPRRLRRRRARASARAARPPRRTPRPRRASQTRAARR